jgi:hypothetical protein
MVPRPVFLHKALKEITDALLVGDWARFANDSTGQFYYVVRESDRNAMGRFGEQWNDVTSSIGQVPGQLEIAFIRAALAEEPSDHFKRARTQFRKAHLDAGIFDRLVSAVRSADSATELTKVIEHWLETVHSEGDLEAWPVAALLEEIRIEATQAGHLLLNEEDLSRIAGALTGRVLRDLVDRYPKIVHRASEFTTGREWLTFHGPQLREAVHCYLYGFFSAAVVVSSAALEMRMKVVAGTDNIAGYARLVAQVFGVAGVRGEDPVLVLALGDLFKLRNKVIHDGHSVTSEDALRALELVRGALDRLGEEPDEISNESA